MASTIAERPPAAIELRRVFRASPDAVFRAWTQPEALKAWWCPSGWIAAEVEIDLRVDGAYRIGMRRLAGGAEVRVCGRFLEVSPPNRLAYTWRWEGAFAGMPETRVTVTLTQIASGTELTLRHEHFTDAGIRQQHRSGWIAACERLDRALPPSERIPAIDAAQ
jgi:uncharacterized protein YndB with AHSA1/START domain